MTIDSVSNIVTVLDRAMTIRNAVIHNSTPFSIVIMFFFILSENVVLVRFFYFKKLS